MTEKIVELAAPAYLMAVAGNADPMLGYLTTSFREHPRLRRRARRHISTAMRGRLVALGVLNESGEPVDGGPIEGPVKENGAASLYASYMKAGGDTRGAEALRAEGTQDKRLARRGYDLGYGYGADYEAPRESVVRRKRSTGTRGTPFTPRWPKRCQRCVAAAVARSHTRR